MAYNYCVYGLEWGVKLRDENFSEFKSKNPPARLIDFFLVHTSNHCSVVLLSRNDDVDSKPEVSYCCEYQRFWTPDRPVLHYGKESREEFPFTYALVSLAFNRAIDYLIKFQTSSVVNVFGFITPEVLKDKKTNPAETMRAILSLITGNVRILILPDAARDKKGGEPKFLVGFDMFRGAEPTLNLFNCIMAYVEHNDDSRWDGFMKPAYGGTVIHSDRLYAEVVFRTKRPIHTAGQKSDCRKYIILFFQGFWTIYCVVFGFISDDPRDISKPFLIYKTSMPLTSQTMEVRHFKTKKSFQPTNDVADDRIAVIIHMMQEIVSRVKSRRFIKYVLMSIYRPMNREDKHSFLSTVGGLCTAILHPYPRVFFFEKREAEKEELFKKSIYNELPEDQKEKINVKEPVPLNTLLGAHLLVKYREFVSSETTG